MHGTIGLGQSLGMGSNGWDLNIIGRFAPRFQRPPVPAHAYMPKADIGAVPSGKSDIRSGSNRLNPSAALLEQQILAVEIIGFTPIRAEQFTTSTAGQSCMEGMGHAMLSNLRAREGGNARVFAATYAIGGAQAGMFLASPNPTLANGNIPFDDVMTGVQAAFDHAAEQGWLFQVDVVVWRQGEANINAPPDYQALVLSVQGPINTAIRAITGQTFDPLWVSGQFSTFEDADLRYSCHGHKTLHIARQVICTGPDYWEDIFSGYADDNQHMSANGYTRFGDLAEDIRHRINDLGETTYDPCVYPVTLTRASGSADFYVTFHLHPDATTLVLDDVLIDDPNGFYGLEAWANGSMLTIDSVTVHSADTLKITVDAVPSDTTNLIKYADVGFTSAFGTTNPDGYVQAERARGCIRDDSERTTSDGSVINAWCLHFSEAVTVTA